MNEVITIENTEMQIREYAGQRVVTFDDICAVHHCERKRLTKHFERKRRHFVKDEDYFEMTRKELNDLTSPNSKIIGNPNIKAYLFTESGYLMIVKCLDDDIAWNVQRQLVNAYFRMKDFREELVTIDELADLRSGHPKYLTSSTPVPKNPSWYDRNKRRIKFICETAGCEHKKLYHVILSRLSDEYNINEANRIYVKEVGHKPQYAIDIVSYFPDLGRMADDILDKLEKCAREEVANR